MFKALAISVLSLLFAIPAGAGLSHTQNNDIPTPIERADGHNWDEEIIKDDGWLVDRIYYNTDFSPKLEKAFCAPNGYAFYLTMNDTILNRLRGEILQVPNVMTDHMSVFFSYTYQGNTIGDINPVAFQEQDILDAGFENPLDGMMYLINETLNGYTVFKSSEIDVSSDISTTITIHISDGDWVTYHLIFNSNVIHIDPFDENDFIRINAQYSLITDEVLIASSPVLGFFNNYSNPNPYGFTTDELNYNEPRIAEASVRAFMKSELGNAKKLFHFRARVEELPTGDNTIGSMILSNKNDDSATWDYFMLSGSTATRNTITWDNTTGTYTFNNPRNFLSNSLTNSINVGDVVEVRLLRDDYEDEDEGTLIRGAGIILSVTPKADAGKVIDTNPEILPDYNLWTCKYEHTLIADDSSIIADYGDDVVSGLIIEHPRQGMVIRSLVTFVSGGKEYSYYSRPVQLKDPGFELKIDGYSNRDTIQRDSEHACEFYMGDLDGVPLNLSSNSRLRINIIPVRLMDKERGHELYDGSALPATGDPSHYYYVPTEQEISLYNDGKIDELNEMPAQGKYYMFDTEENRFKEYTGIQLFNYLISQYDYVEDFTHTTFSVPFVGKWQFQFYDIRFQYTDLTVEFANRLSGVFYSPLEVVLASEEVETINLNVPDEVNLLMGGNTLDIIPSLSNSEDEVFYYDWSVNKANIIDFVEQDDGRVTIEALRAGMVDLTVSAESKYSPKVTKTVHVRVLEGIYGVAKLVVPDTFHSAKEDLIVSVDIRGITIFQNIKIDWKIIDKDKKDIPENKYVVNDNATLTLLKPGNADYTVTAFYEGVQLDSIKLEFRYIDMNAFLKMNIWWIVVITIGFVAFGIIVGKMTSRGRTTVQHVDLVYTTFSTYLSDNKLTKNELKKTKRALTRCIGSCESINIEASNQYEKTIRYLKKSLNDTKVLLNNWDKVDEVEMSVFINRLDKDLYKALLVAKEIETARDLNDEYHFKANKKNYETVEPEKPTKDKKNKDNK